MDKATYIAALEEEKAGYERAGKKDRAAEVDAEIKHAREGGSAKSVPDVYPAKGSVDDVMAYVEAADTRARAEQALQLEVDKGDKARSGLVKKLKAVLGLED